MTSRTLIHHWKGLLLVAMGVIAPLGLSAADPLPFTVAWSTPAETRTQQGRLEQFGTLADGRALFLGVPATAPVPDISGADKAILLFDPTANAFVWKSLLPAAIRHYAVKLLPLADGKVFVLGQNTPNTSSKPPWYAFVYDPATDAFTAKATMSLAYQIFEPVTRFQLPSGEIYVGGGSPGVGAQADGFLYEPSSNTWRVGLATPAGFAHSQESTNGLVSLGNGRFFRGGSKPGTIVATSSAIFDPVGMAWATYPSPDFTNGSHYLTLVQDKIYGSSYTNDNNTFKLISYDLNTNTYALVENRSNITGLMSIRSFTLRAAGRDYLCTVSSAAAGNSGFGRFDSKVWDPVAGAWVDLAQSPTAILETNNYGMRSVTLQDGFLIVVPFQSGAVKSQRLRLTSGTGPTVPYVDPVGFPASLTLNEGSSTTISYRILGDIPPAGVTVVVERSQGDGDVRVIDVVRDPILSASTTRTARIVSQIDADSINDSATIRLRVIQANQSIDPKAISIPVTVIDRYQEASQKPGDMNGDGVVNALDLDQVIQNFGN